jgi:integrase
VAYLMARCAPPLDAGLPRGWPAAVLAATAAGDISLLRRFCRIRRDTASLARFDTAQADVSSLARLLGGPKREKSAKHPVLLADVATFLGLPAKAGRTSAKRRNGFLLALGLLFGLRRSEMVSLHVADIQVAGNRITLRVLRDKTNQSLLGQHAARTVTTEHAILGRSWLAFRSLVDSNRDSPLFQPFDTQGRPTGRPMAANSINGVVREAIGAHVSPHSLRVGCATELAANGVAVATIMLIGRWRTEAALRYVLPDALATCAATRGLGAVRAPVIQT